MLWQVAPCTFLVMNSSVFRVFQLTYELNLQLSTNKFRKKSQVTHHATKQSTPTCMLTDTILMQFQINRFSWKIQFQTCLNLFITKIKKQNGKPIFLNTRKRYPVVHVMLWEVAPCTFLVMNSSFSRVFQLSYEINLQIISTNKYCKNQQVFFQSWEVHQGRSAYM